MFVCISTYVTLQAPEIDNCSMLPIKLYDVRIDSSDSKSEIVSKQIFNALTLSFEHMDKQFIVNITVVDIIGQRSNSIITEKTAQDVTSSKHNFDIINIIICTYVANIYISKTA